VVAALLVLGLGATLSAGTSVAVAVASGAILMATGALHRFAGGLGALTDALVAWEQVQPLWTAGGLAPSPGAPALAAHTEAPPAELARGRKLIEMVGLHFQHGGRSRPVLQGATLELRDGDRVLLEGPSGGGKSTLASLLVGLRQPDSGLLLLRGLDRRTLGEALWRRRAVSAPQFHENRVIIGTFAFNLLLGRSWPAAEEEIAEAEVLCRELGLGPLLDRMPSGMLQMVGESGWQLSHGEKSRLYLARALLQKADLIVLDESFGALDPENMGLALRCALRRGRTLVVIAHP
jgi:ATP-binding cassette subfamily B protein